MTEVVYAGAPLLALSIAFLAGMIAFASPCILPLAPGYLSYVTGLSGAEVASGTGSRRRLLAGTLLFVVGFSVVFVSYGALLGGAGAVLLGYQDLINRILGVVVIVMGLAFLGLIPGLQRDVRPRATPRWSVASAPLIGAAFGLGWTPCIGPTLTAVQALAFTQAGAMRGAILSLAYCFGLGLPFVLLALAFERLVGAVAWLRNHSTVIMRVGGAMLVVVGVLLLSGLWTDFTIWLRTISPSFVTLL